VTALDVARALLMLAPPLVLLGGVAVAFAFLAALVWHQIIDARVRRRLEDAEHLIAHAEAMRTIARRELSESQALRTLAAELLDRVDLDR